MSLLKKRQRSAAVGLASHTVGNAMVVYPERQMTQQARDLALSVAKDPDREVVIVDLPEGAPVAAWDQLAESLPRRRGGVRLVLGGRSRETAALAGQWLSERIGRPVVAPDGVVVSAAGGTLFVHEGPGSGWVRFQPGKAPEWEAKRFPRPGWDSGVTDSWQTSSAGVAEPIPGGVWIHAAGDTAQDRAHWRYLVDQVPCQPNVLTVVLGCPQSPALSLDDVARFWQRLDAGLRAQVRFVGYGPLRTGAGQPFGQALADLLGEQVVCYTGIPVGSPEAPKIFVPGSTGWYATARELAYTPAEEQGAEQQLPALHSYRQPIFGAQQVARAVFWYAPDAVVEVVQSGLWMRPPNNPANAQQVRGARLDPSALCFYYEASTPQLAQRMRQLAEDALARLDPETQRAGRLLPSAAAGGSPVRAPGPALGELPSRRDNETTSSAVPAPPKPHAPSDVYSEPSKVPGADGATVVLSRQQIAALDLSVAAPGERRDPGSPAPQPPGPVRAAGGRPLGDAATSGPARQPVGNAALPREGVAGQAVREGRGPHSSAGEQPDAATPDSAAPETAVPVVAAATRASATARWQRTPESDSVALVPERGLEQERSWLRSRLSREFDLHANTVSRVLSEQPGLQRGGSNVDSDTLTDSVAVRMYLSAQGAAVDSALRSARNGSHVPFARCVVAGLTKLPSHRGAAVFAASPTRQQWQLYQQRTVLTEWSFLNALTAPSDGMPGAVDVLIWSITARRTKLLEPDDGEGVADRVLFVPGTNFKVLELSEGAAGTRGQILLRELTANEVDETGKVDRGLAQLDDLAVTSLRNCIERWSQTPARTRVAAAAVSRFGALPGLTEE